MVIQLRNCSWDQRPVARAKMIFGELLSLKWLGKVLQVCEFHYVLAGWWIVWIWKEYLNCLLDFLISQLSFAAEVASYWGFFCGWNLWFDNFFKLKWLGKVFYWSLGISQLPRKCLEWMALTLCKKVERGQFLELCKLFAFQYVLFATLLQIYCLLYFWTTELLEQILVINLGFWIWNKEDYLICIASDVKGYLICCQKSIWNSYILSIESFPKKGVLKPDSWRTPVNYYSCQQVWVRSLPWTMIL